MGVPGATVRVEGTGAIARTDAEGRFALCDLAAGTQTLLVSAPSWREATVVIGDEAGPRTVEVPLAWAGTVERSRTTSTATRFVDTASGVELDADDLAAAPRRSSEDLLRQVPGLTLVQHGSEGKGHQFFLRGFDAAHGADLEITVAGLPVNEWSNIHAQGYIDLGFVIPELVRGLEVTKGPFGVEQGPFAMAGAADLRTGPADDALGWVAAYTAGSTGVTASWRPGRRAMATGPRTRGSRRPTTMASATGGDSTG